jgi:TorA maturation chaperone TorD
MERSLARSNTYHILSRCFTYPDERIYSWIWEGEWLMKLRDSLSLLVDDNFEGHLVVFEKMIKGKQKAIQAQMAREYTLFLNVVSLHAIDQPCGSIELEKGEAAFGKSNTEELRFFHEAGFTLKEDLGDLSDHIASKLEFMGILADQESRVLGGEKIRLEEVQLAFLSKYIIPWVPTFYEKVTKQNGLLFYFVLGELTREFISFEKDYLGFTEEIDSNKDRKSETPRRFI